MDETDYFQKRDKYKKRVVDDEWGALKKIKTGQGPQKKPSLADTLVLELGKALDKRGLGLVQLNKLACLPIRR